MNGGGRWEPKPIPEYVTKGIPGCKPAYEVELDREEEERQIHRANPIIRDGGEPLHMLNSLYAKRSLKPIQQIFSSAARERLSLPRRGGLSRFLPSEAVQHLCVLYVHSPASAGISEGKEAYIPFRTVPIEYVGNTPVIPK